MQKPSFYQAGWATFIQQVKHHKVPRLFVGTKKWQSVRRQNGSGSVQICRENALAVNMEPDGSLKLRVED